MTIEIELLEHIGKHSVHKEFDSITMIGVFNPRLNNAYVLDISKISEETISTVEKEIIGYKGKAAKKEPPKELNNNLISLPDLLKETGYLRSMIMRWYKREGFPMKKIKTDTIPIDMNGRN